MERDHDAPPEDPTPVLEPAEAAFEAEGARSEQEADFRVDVDGYEGPLDLLLELARRQKVDLSRISVLALAEQYLEFIEAARRIRLELAADYLVMAAWLAYLKSRLLLPAPPKTEEPDAKDLAANLARRLSRLQAIRVAAERLMNRPAPGPRPVHARRAGRARYRQCADFPREPVRSAVGLRPPASEAGLVPCLAQAPAGLVPRRGARGARAHHRHGGRMDRA